MSVTTDVLSPLRMAVIGAGAMGHAHCRTMAEGVDGMRLAAVVDVHADTACGVADTFGVPAFTSVAALLKAGGADAAVVATPHPLHLAAVEACLDGGLHVLCEKPLAETVSSADRMLAAAGRAGRALGVMFQRRYDPVFEAALRFVQDGGLGDVRRTLLILPDFRTQAYYDANPWRATWTGEGGGVLVNQAPHLMDLFIQLGGMPSTVNGWTSHRLHDIDVEDQAEARLSYAGGATGYVYASTNEPDHFERIEIAGTRGCLSWRRGKLECMSYGADIEAVSAGTSEIWWRPAVGDATPAFETVAAVQLQRLLLVDFARHILKGDPLRCDARSGRQSLELANAIMLSGQLGTAVTLPVDRGAYDALLARLRASSRSPKPDRPTIRETDPRLR